MKEHSINVQSIAKPVWLVLKPSLIPPFMITSKHKRKSEHLPHFIQKMKTENMNPAVIETFPHYSAKARNGAKLFQYNVL